MLQYATIARNAELDALGELLADGARLELRTGPPPPRCPAADTGELLVEIRLPRRPFARAFDGVLAKVGMWAGFASSTTNGVAGYFRLKDASGVCAAQSTVTAFDRGGDLQIDDPVIEPGSGGSSSLTYGRRVNGVRYPCRPAPGPPDGRSYRRGPRLHA